MTDGRNGTGDPRDEMPRNAIGNRSIAANHAVPEAISAAVQAVGWPGIALPRTRICGRLVYPVVDIDPAAWEKRLQAAHLPELSRSTLKIWEGWTTDLGPIPPQTVLSIVGLVSDGRPQAALDTLCALGGAGGGLLVSTGLRGPTPVTLMECDLEDISAVWVPPQGEPRVLVRGRLGPVATARRIVLTRYYEEVLFQWALSTGYRAEFVHRSRPVNVCSHERRGAR